MGKFESGRDFTGFMPTFSNLYKKAMKADDAFYFRKHDAEGDDMILPGSNCTKLFEPLPTYDKKECEIVIPGSNGSPNNASIVFGRDRHTREAWDGYGGKGCTSSGMIDIVVGRGGPAMGGSVLDTESRHQKIIGPNFFADAARIYLSQRADIDKYFALPCDDNGSDLLGGGVRSSQNRSAIGIKADAVRIIGREGVRIFSNPRTKSNNPKEYNSRGGEIQSDGADRGIHLIANGEVGSFDSWNPEIPSTEPFIKRNKVQPLVKGDNLRYAMNELLNMLITQADAIQTFINAQMRYNASLAFHTHEVVGALPAMTTPSIPGVTEWASNTAFQQVANAALAMETFKKNIVVDYRTQFFSDGSPFCFLSRYNRTN